MRVLILGGEGMLGHKVFQVLSRYFDTLVTFRSFSWPRYPVYKDMHCGRTIGGVDAMDFATVARVLTQIKPDVVVNCIGVVKQLPGAKDPVISIAVNSLFPHWLARLCAARGSRMFHFSTDCVFSGRKGNYAEYDTPDPEDLYGHTKWLGEVNCDGCLTLRTAFFGRDFAKRSALLEWFLGNRGGHVQGYVNAIYTGFPTQVLAEILGDLITDYPDLSGLYQVSSAPISKYSLLVTIRNAMQLDIEIEPFQDFYCDRSMNSSRFWAEIGYPAPTWGDMIAELAQDDTPYDEWHTTTRR